MTENNNGIEKCIWKISYDHAMNSNGTTFKDIIKYEVYTPCKKCDGYYIICRNYTAKSPDFEYAKTESFRRTGEGK